MHRPDATAHDDGTGADPRAPAKVRPRGSDATGDRQGNISGEDRDDDRRRDQRRVVDADVFGRRIGRIENWKKPPIEMPHRHRHSGRVKCATLKGIGEFFLKAGLVIPGWKPGYGRPDFVAAASGCGPWTALDRA